MDNKYKYSFEKTSNYCYANSDVLINKLNIKIEEELFLKERQFVAYRSGEIEKSPITGDFDFEHLKQIHKHLFQDVYNWAGEIRTCNIAKTDLFCLAQHIESYGADIFAKLKKQNYFLEKSYSDKIYSLVELLSDINALHPFREGNGRVQREFIFMLAKVNGINIDFSNISEEEMIIASHESINGHYEKFNTMFNKICTTISKEEQKQSIEAYVSNKELKNTLLGLI